MRTRAPIVGVGLGGSLYLAVSCFLLVGMRQNLTVPLSFGLSIGQFLLFACGGLWALTRLRGERSSIRDRSFTIVILIYSVAALASYASAMGRGIPAKATASSTQYMLITLGMTAMVFATIAIVTTTDRLLLVLKGLVLGGTLSATFALVQFATGMDLAGDFRLPGLKTSDFMLVRGLAREGIVRSQGSAGHPLELAAVLTALIPIGVGLTACARARGQRTWPWALCTVALLAGAVVTVSRSVFLGLAAAVAVMAWRWSIGRLAAIFAALIAAAGLAWLLQIKILTAFTSSFENSHKDPSLASRQNGMDYVLSQYQHHAWFGQGIGTYPAYVNQPVLDNEYLSRLIDSGILGVAAYLGLLVFVLSMAVRASAAKSTVNAEIGSALSGSMAVLIAIGAILDVSGFTQCGCLIWLIIALCPIALHLSRHGDVRSDRSESQEVGWSGVSEPAG
jgi:putative inorganic carbon (hco3(-)) transporter